RISKPHEPAERARRPGGDRDGDHDHLVEVGEVDLRRGVVPVVAVGLLPRRVVGHNEKSNGCQPWRVCAAVSAAASASVWGAYRLRRSARKLSTGEGMPQSMSNSNDLARITQSSIHAQGSSCEPSKAYSCKFESLSCS